MQGSYLHEIPAHAEPRTVPGTAMSVTQQPLYQVQTQPQHGSARATRHALDAKRHRTNGPMPNLLATELRKYMPSSRAPSDVA